MATSSGVPDKPHPRALPAEVVKEAARNGEAYRLRQQGQTYGEIAKVLDLPGGWLEAYRIVADTYGKLVADIDTAELRAREAGRLMDIRAGIEGDVRRGDPKMIEADLKMSQQIDSLLGLSAHAAPAGASGGGGPNVQINISPPWERGGVTVDTAPLPDVIDGEVVEEG
jgi:hypothetical protein